MATEYKKYPTRSMTTLPARLIKDPEIFDKGAEDMNLTKVTVVDATGSERHKDVFVTACWKGKRGEILQKLRKGDFVTLIGKIDYRCYVKGDKKAKAEDVQIAGDMWNPEFAIGVSLKDRKPVEGGSAQKDDQDDSDEDDSQDSPSPAGGDDLPF